MKFELLCLLVVIVSVCVSYFFYRLYSATNEYLVDISAELNRMKQNAESLARHEKEMKDIEKDRAEKDRIIGETDETEVLDVINGIARANNDRLCNGKAE